MADVFVGLGANLGDAERNLRVAVERLAEGMEIRAISSLYRSEPVGVRDQPDFVNAVVEGRSERRPGELMAWFLAIERDLGRVRDVPMGPRTLDLDLLLYGGESFGEPGLRVPHPRMTARRFVLEPLAEIAPGVIHPPSGRTAEELLARLSDAPAVTRLERANWPPAPWGRTGPI